MKDALGWAATLACLVAGLLMPTCNGVNAADNCDGWLGRLVSLQGQVYVKKAGQADWALATMGQAFCAGDQIRVAANSRAAFVLPNDALLRADQNTSLVFDGVERQKTYLIDLVKGMVHFFSRKVRSLKVVTPFVNGTVEGTEFLVQVEQDRALLSLFEGRLRTENARGSLLLTAGQALTAEKGRALHAYTMIHPRDAVQWALYYPPVLSLAVSDEAFMSGRDTLQKMDRARRALARGDNDRALVILESLDDPAAWVPRAALRLQVGRVEQARHDLTRALEMDPLNGRALALRAVMAVVHNRGDEALQLARQAVAAAPRSAATHIALSYALQARFDLRGALGQIHDAAAVEPQNGLVRARLAELHLALGDTTAALTEADKAVRLAPALATSHTILGFAHLVGIDTKAARQAFLKAIELDSAAPLPRLGLGMVMIRDGKLPAGRAQIEIAAGLDPNNAMIRSYLGKAYFDEKRDPRDGRQLEIAKTLDPNDPTPWFYDAIRKRSLNRPVQALRDLRKSIELNDNRAVYRSRFQLDEDLAARSVSLGRIYSDLGFGQMGLVQGWTSVSREPGNFSAHRLLADLYATLPRHEHARSSELLQAQLLQPATIAPVQPHLTGSDLTYLNNSGLVSPSLNEYSQLYVRDRLSGQVNAVAGEQDILGEEVILSGVKGQLSFSSDQLFLKSEGFRENNDQSLKAHDLFGQVRVSRQTSAQFAYQWLDEDKGDLSLKFNRDNYFPTLRQTRTTHAIRLSLRHELTPSQSFLISGTHTDRDEGATGFGPVTLNYDTKTYYYEGLYLYQGRRIDVTAGAGDYRKMTQEKFTLAAAPVSSTSDTVTKHRYYYLYNNLSFSEAMTWIVGVSYGAYEDPDFDESQTNPKLGLIWRPGAGTTIRAAYFRNISREYSDMPTLEPSNVAGFNQLFDDGPGSDVWCKGAGIDLELVDQLNLGAEYISREIKILYLDRSHSIAEARKASWEQELYRTYIYWTPDTRIVPALDIYFEQFTRTSDTRIPTDISEMRNWRVAPALSFFPSDNVSFKVTATYIEQSGRFSNNVGQFDFGSDTFWVFDAVFRYYLPKRFGLISLEGKNILNESFSFQDTDPANSFVPPDRQVLLKVSLMF